MAEIMFSSDSVCLCVCVCVRVRSETVNQTVGPLNAYSSKTVKAAVFKFDVHVSKDIPYVIP